MNLLVAVRLDKARDYYTILIGYLNLAFYCTSNSTVHRLIGFWEGVRQVPRYSQHRILGKSARYLGDWQGCHGVDAHGVK